MRKPKSPSSSSFALLWKKKSTTTKETTKTQTRDQSQNHTKPEINHEPKGKPSQRTHELANLGGEPMNPSSDWTHKCVWFLKRRSFSLCSLFFICAEQELESLILEFHWKSFPTDLSSTGNRLLHTRVATVDSSILNSRCYFYK